MTSFAPFGGLILFAITVFFVFLSSAVGQKLSRINAWATIVISVFLFVLTVMFAEPIAKSTQSYGAAVMVWLSVLGSFFITAFNKE